MLVLQFPLSYAVSYYRSAARETGMTTGDVHKALQRTVETFLLLDRIHVALSRSELTLITSSRVQGCAKGS